jgi:hypothetical protein
MSHDVYKLFAQYDPALVDLFPFAYDQLNMPTVEEQRKAGSNTYFNIRQSHFLFVKIHFAVNINSYNFLDIIFFWQ